MLASEVARRLFPIIEGDVFFVELVSLADPGLVASAVANALALRLGGDEISPASVARAIGGRKMLLVLDNCEHVIDAAANLAETLLRLCPGMTALATSREALRIEGEYVYHVAPLEVPSRQQATPDDALGHSAVQLFIARTQSLLADFVADGGNLPAIVAICRRLDGIPLAIEFAAARAAMLGVEQVAARIDDRFALLTRGRRTALPRHQTLRATLDWSYELLPVAEQRLLRGLSVFPAGFTLDAAAAIMSDAGVAVTEGISNLVAKSLVTIDGSAPGGRWRLLETIRAYAFEKLTGSGEHENSGAATCRILSRPGRAIGAGDRGNATLRPRNRQRAGRTRLVLLAAGRRRDRGGADLCLYAGLVDLGLLVELRERAERALAAHGPAAIPSARLRIQLNLGLVFAGLFTMASITRIRAVIATALDLAEESG